MARHDDTTPGPLPEGKRVWPRNAALALAAAGAAFLVLKLTGTAPAGGDGGAPEDEAAPSVTPAAPSTTAAATPASAAARPMIPLDDVFPAAVPDGKGGRFTKVGAAVLNSCKEPGAVGPRLAALIDASKGCVGEQVALYKDGRNNQYNIAVFTMKDPVDTLHLVTELSAAFDDYQVAAQAPPAGSGLRTLSPTSGMVQSFAGVGRTMVVGLGQWSDGRTADFQKLVDQLTPLQNAVSTKTAAYEHAT
ncbi:hypothetical protein ACF09L_27075 [Streptomyces sp. NPDC014779]|uniref:hypothetical protein n=1 Tax=Streptomyces sp. NPDC014779 TaxID=3364911 RepID=UPI0036FA573A